MRLLYLVKCEGAGHMDIEGAGFDQAVEPVGCLLTAVAVVKTEADAGLGLWLG